jgi:hypothetical protein
MRVRMNRSDTSLAVAAYAASRLRLHSAGCVPCVYALVLCVLSSASPALAEATEPEPETYEPAYDLSASFGSGFMRGGAGGLTVAQRNPFTVDVAVMGIRDAHWLLGGALRLELEDGKSVAGIARAALRHRMGSIELRPGAGLPFYFAPRTMLGAEVSLGVRCALSSGFGVLAQLAASAFMIGSDVPDGTTVIMFHLFLGIDLVL